MEVQFSVGDRVKIRNDLEKNQRYDGFFFTDDMYKLRGMEALVVESYEDTYLLNIFNKPWFTDPMLIHVEDLPIHFCEPLY